MVPDPVVGVLTPADARRTGGCGHQIVNHFKVGSRRFRRIGAAVRRLQTIGPSQAVIWRRLARRNHNGWTKNLGQTRVARRWLSIWQARVAGRFGKLMARHRVAAAAAALNNVPAGAAQKRAAKPPAGSRQR